MIDQQTTPIASDPASLSLSDWQPAAPRDEIRPTFAFDSGGGPDGEGALVIQADEREGLDGWWSKAFAITGGRHYRFLARYRAHNVQVPRRSILAKFDWRNESGEPVLTDVFEPTQTAEDPNAVVDLNR